MRGNVFNTSFTQEKKIRSKQGKEELSIFKVDINEKIVMQQVLWISKEIV